MSKKRNKSRLGRLTATSNMVQAQKRANTTGFAAGYGVAEGAFEDINNSHGTMRFDHMRRTMEKKYGEAFPESDWYTTFGGGDSGQEVPFPCEMCGVKGDARPDDRYSMLPGAREVPLAPLDARAGEEGDHIVRICAACTREPDVRDALIQLDIQDAESMNPLKVAQAHRVAMRGLRGDNAAGNLLDGEAREIYDSIMSGLRQLVENGQIPAEALVENPDHTVQILAELRLSYGEITSRPDLPEMFKAAWDNSEWCEKCERGFPKGTHNHMRHKLQVKLDDLPDDTELDDSGRVGINGSRVCDSAQLLTLNMLANFMAFERTIPYSVMSKIDTHGTHILGFIESGDTARSVQVQDYFRSRVLVKIAGREKPVQVQLDIPPLWFLRLEDIDRDAEGLPTVKKNASMRASSIQGELTSPIDKPTWHQIPVRQNERGFVEVTAPDGSVTEYDPANVERAQNGDVKMEMDGLTVEQRRSFNALHAFADEQGVGDYRNLGDFDAWSFLANHPAPIIVHHRFSLAIAAAVMAWENHSGPFTVAEVQSLLDAIRDSPDEIIPGAAGVQMVEALRRMTP